MKCNKIKLLKITCAAILLFNCLLTSAFSVNNNASDVVLSSKTLASAPIIAGKDYTLLTTPGIIKTIPHDGKVNVKEFFSFTCVHCKDIEPLVESQLLSNQKIQLEKIQVVWDKTTTEYAKLDATIQSMNLNKLYVPVFTAIFAGTNLTDLPTLKQFLIANQLTKRQVNKFLISYESFGISSKATHYKDLTSKYGIVGTPTFIVADKYIISPAAPQHVIAVVSFLVKQQSTK